jgi:hypothetical protein
MLALTWTGAPLKYQILYISFFELPPLSTVAKQAFAVITVGQRSGVVVRHKDVISANFGNGGVVIARRRSCMGLKQQHRKRDMKEKSLAESECALCTLERHKDML